MLHPTHGLHCMSLEIDRLKKQINWKEVMFTGHRLGLGLGLGLFV